MGEQIRELQEAVGLAQREISRLKSTRLPAPYRPR
jgi:hypothetical protein